MGKIFHKTLIGMGSNVGDRVAMCCAAIERLRVHPSIEDVRTSPFYETAPVGVTEQPPFLNLAIEARTTLSPTDLLATLKNLEQELGRVRRFRWGPREIDLDILLYDSLILSTDRLTIPHPEMHKRAFVLVPACDIAADWPHPVLQKPLDALLNAVSLEEVTPYRGPVPCV